MPVPIAAEPHGGEVDDIFVSVVFDQETEESFGDVGGQVLLLEGLVAHLQILLEDLVHETMGDVVPFVVDEAALEEGEDIQLLDVGGFLHVGKLELKNGLDELEDLISEESYWPDVLAGGAFDFFCLLLELDEEVEEFRETGKDPLDLEMGVLGDFGILGLFFGIFFVLPQVE